jgi:hypothetical protein
MNQKILLALLFTASITQPSALFRAARRVGSATVQQLSRRAITVDAHAAKLQAKKDDKLHKEMSKLIEAQAGFLAALQDGANPMTQFPTSQRVTKRIVYEFIKDDKSQEIAEAIYEAAGKKYRNCIADIAAHYNNDNLLLTALAKGATLHCSGGHDTLVKTYFARLVKYKIDDQKVQRGNLGKLFLDSLDEEELNDTDIFGMTILEAIIENEDYDLIPPALEHGADPEIFEHHGSPELFSLKEILTDAKLSGDNGRIKRTQSAIKLIKAHQAKQTEPITFDGEPLHGI